MKFEDKLTRHQSNLSNAYDLLLEARERDALQDEIIRDWILSDTTLFDRLARRWLDDPINREGFLDQAIEWVKAERTPAHTQAWRDPLRLNKIVEVARNNESGEVNP